jgi:hypothetical protein
MNRLAAACLMLSLTDAVARSTARRFRLYLRFVGATRRPRARFVGRARINAPGGQS